MHSDKEIGYRGLSDTQREQFVRDGFVKLENAFWRETGCDPDDRTR
jgi:hypothetical protein